MFKDPGFYMHNSHLMFDLETGGLPSTPGPGVVILSIGAVIFDPYRPLQPSKELKRHSFYVNITEQSCLDAGLVWDPSTREWWNQQSDDAWCALQFDQAPLISAVSAFIEWLAAHPYSLTGYWANSPSFDKVLLERAMQAVGRRWPAQLPFYMENDVRTLKRLAWPNGDAPDTLDGIAHNALDDAIKQCRLVQLAHRKLGLTIEEQVA